MANRLYTLTAAGNVHEAAHYINERVPEVIDHVVSIDYKSGNYSTVLMRMPPELWDKLKRERRI